MRTFLLAIALFLVLVACVFLKFARIAQAQPAQQPNIAEITVFDEIKPDMAIHVAGKLIAACEEDGDGPILLVIAGPGGDITAGNMIVDAMQHCTKHPVNTLCIGPCESMDAIIFEYGKTRTMWPRAFLMFHRAFVGGQGSLEQVANQLRLWNTYVPAYEHDIAARAGIPFDVYRQRTNDQWYLRADEAVKAGLADSIER